MSRYFVQIDPVTKVPFVYLDNPLLLKRKDVFEVDEKQARKFQKMQADRKPYGETDKLHPAEKVKALIQEEAKKADATESNPITSDITPSTVIVDSSDPEKSQPVLYDDAIKSLNGMRRSSQIEEFMLRKYRIEIPHGNREDVLAVAIERLAELRDLKKL